LNTRGSHEIQEAKIESKAISFSRYTLTPSPGNIFVDVLIMCTRDVTLRLRDYQLKTVAKHFLNRDKDDVHYSEIKGLFYGSATDRGILAAYNLQVLFRLSAGRDPLGLRSDARHLFQMRTLAQDGQHLPRQPGFHERSVSERSAGMNIPRMSLTLADSRFWRFSQECHGRWLRRLPSSLSSSPG
jgi:hypothetical protein